MKWLRLFSHRRFHRVLTGDEALLAQIPNGILFPMGGTWVPEWRGLRVEKRGECSLIASGKRSQIGHRLRHEVADWARVTDKPVTLIGRGFAPFAHKSDGLAPYRYSVVIENVRERNYFSEKLIDALLCRTVPIYWGCPNIADYFDTRAMVICEDLKQIQSAIAAMSKKDFDARQPFMAAARDVAATYADLNLRAAHAVVKSG